MTLITSVAKSEGYTLGQGVADLVALLSEGSYRDALSTLEKVFTVSKDKTISRTEAEKATGAPRHELIENLVEALSKGEKGTALSTIQKAQGQDIDMSLYLSMVLEYLRQVLLVRHAPELQSALQEELGEEYENVKRKAEDKESKLSHETLRVFLDASARIRFSPIPALALELAVLELLSQNK